MKVFRQIALALVVSSTIIFGAANAAPSSVTLVSEEKVVIPAQSTWVGIQFEVEEGWHIYWKNPGDSGMAPELEWTLPEGFKIGKVHWPTPEKFQEEDLTAFGYSKTITLIAEVIVPQGLEEGKEVDLEVAASWVACKDSCIPVSASSKVTLKVGQGGVKGDSFEQLRGQLPGSGDHLVAKRSKGQVAIELPADATEAYFFPDNGEVINGQSISEGALMVPAASAMHGVLVVGQESFEVDLPPPSMGGISGLGIAILFAFLGGLILNLMPCVLPVISLKILSFVDMAGSSRRKALGHGLQFTAGVVVSFLVLAGALLALRAFGASVGWGFQLQEPIFVVILSLILFLLSLSLFGVFEFGTKLTHVGGKVDRTKTFLSGVLATVVATPCTGPLLAPALGYAVTLPPLISLFVFAVMGVGMASPYLLFSAFPRLLRFLPKPGPWMVVFKQIMGFVMLATVLWLLWVFYAQVPSGIALLGLLVAFLLVGIGAWIFGRWGTPVQKKRKRRIAYLFAAAFIGFGGLLGIRLSDEKNPLVAGTVNVQSHTSEEWLVWNQEEFARLRKEGKPVFVDFTARWCLTCQTNKLALGAKKVREKFEEAGVVTMEADWTRRDPAITAELEKFGRSGVPLYVLYHGDKTTILPQMLTQQSIIDVIDNLD